jgi:predicted acyltransferase
MGAIMDETQLKSQEDKQQDKLAGRIVSIDALRGFDMFWIIGGGAIFSSLHNIFNSSATELIRTQLRHVEWEGFRFEDLIMPLFLFIVGVVMPFSFNKRLNKCSGKIRLYLHIIKRTVILFVLGMVAQGHLLEYDLSKLHIYSNTLQAIAAGYIIAAIIMLNLGIRWQIAVTGILLVLFWALMMLVPFPGRGADVLTPDSNLAIYIDRVILGPYIDGTNPPYTWILSSLTFPCTVMLGLMAGHVLRTDKVGIRKVVWLLTIGTGCIVAGLLWSMFFPIIKHIWTSSFVLLSGGICFILLALFYFVIDVLGFRKWAYGFVVIGMNAIAVYMAVHIVNFRNIGGVFVEGFEKYIGKWYPFIHALAGFVVVWLILWWMYRKKTFIKI